MKKAPKIIIDGKESSKMEFEKLSPDDIEKVEIFKGEKAVEKYKSPNGVIVIKTKKGQRN
ncbi:hypothetical protein [Maribacter sp. 2210JD10-5]|uniref:hypothetical protein n=1 Tax=Maribacter sp. 2210JD10-5 TaxID=3386272 RepID=UPI0039BD4E34